MSNLNAIQPLAHKAFCIWADILDKTLLWFDTKQNLGKNVEDLDNIGMFDMH